MRIQVLNLPDRLVDGELRSRFVLVLDEHPTAGTPLGKKLAKKFDRFAMGVGAEGGLISAERVEIEDTTAATADMVTEIVQQLDGLISRRLDEHQGARTSFHYTPSTVTNGTFMKWWAEADRCRRDGGR